MTVVVADASPIRYLVMVGAIGVLPRLFDRVILPDHVARVEPRDPQSPQPVQAWVAALPEWLEIQTPSGSAFLLRVAGTAQGLPADMAENHDHYLHGLPKRSH